jgi:hypothetical protein
MLDISVSLFKRLKIIGRVPEIVTVVISGA